jgi:ATP-dependent RNA helicase DHX37/DHR1
MNSEENEEKIEMLDSVTNIFITNKIIAASENSTELPDIKEIIKEYKTKSKEYTSAPYHFIPVSRSEKINSQRECLPIFFEESRVIEYINQNYVVIICGETGSGKTTQVPQFLWEAGYGHPCSSHPGMIGVTQPRRIAATSVCERVSEELNEQGTGRVGYQIRYDSTITSNSKDPTRLKFMTDGILLREVQSDPFLRKYSVIIIDEAHERTTNTDILLGLLSRIVIARKKNGRERNKKKIEKETKKK